MKKYVKIRIILLLEILIFFSAALIHFGFIIPGYEHNKARIAELIIAAVLVYGLAAVIINPLKTKKTAKIVQWIALAGTLIGLFTIAIGVGPQSSLDLGLHAVMILLLSIGLIITKKDK